MFNTHSARFASSFVLHKYCAITGWPRPSATEARDREGIWNSRAQSDHSTSAIPRRLANDIVQDLNASSLGRQVLAKCWSLADASTHDGALSKHEFEIFHYLITRALRDGIQPPSKIPFSPFPPIPEQQQQQEQPSDDPFGTDLFSERIGGAEQLRSSAFNTDIHGAPQQQQSQQQQQQQQPRQQPETHAFGDGFDAGSQQQSTFDTAFDGSRRQQKSSSTVDGSDARFVAEFGGGAASQQPLQSPEAGQDVFGGSEQHQQQQQAQQDTLGSSGNFDAFGSDSQPQQQQEGPFQQRTQNHASADASGFEQQQSLPQQHPQKQQHHHHHQQSTVQGSMDTFSSFGSGNHQTNQQHHPQHQQPVSHSGAQASSGMYGSGIAGVDSFGGGSASQMYLQQPQHHQQQQSNQDPFGSSDGFNTAPHSQQHQLGQQQQVSAAAFGSQQSDTFSGIGSSQQAQQHPQQQPTAFDTISSGAGRQQQEPQQPGDHAMLGTTGQAQLPQQQQPGNGVEGFSQQHQHQHAKQRPFSNGDMFNGGTASDGEVTALEEKKADLSGRLQTAFGSAGSETSQQQRKEQLQKEVQDLRERVEKAEANAKEVNELVEEENTLQQRLQAASSAEQQLSTIKSRLEASGLSESRERVLKEALSIVQFVGLAASQANSPTQTTSSGGSLNFGT
jgi:hypothetical protein